MAIPIDQAMKQMRFTEGKKQRGNDSEPSRGKVISRLLDQMMKKLNVKDSKVSLTDFIRLLQLERELLGEGQPREIIVSWEESTGT